MSELKEYHFTDEQIDFLMQFVRNNAQFEDGEDRDWMEDLANQIEDQIVNHRDNDWTGTGGLTAPIRSLIVLMFTTEQHAY